MLVAGLDIGSRTIALVEWDGTQIVRSVVVDTGNDPLGNARALLVDRVYDRLVATGYGRNLAAERELASEVISEIKAYGLGVTTSTPTSAPSWTSAARTARPSTSAPAAGCSASR